MNNHSKFQASSNTSQKTQNEGFFNKIYRYLINLIQKNHNENSKDINKKLNESMNYYENYYKNRINFFVKEPSISKFGLVNLLNDCYIVSFLQILFHTPNFLSILKKYNSNKEETIASYLILVSEHPFNAEIFYRLKQLLGAINPEYSKPWSNDSQEFGIDLINHLISEMKGPIYENNDEIENINESLDFIQVKKKVYDNYISTYQNKLNELEKLFLFNQIDIFCKENSKNPRISSNLHLELTLQTYQNYIEIESLIGQKYKNEDIQPNNNQIIINSKIASLPEILIISINRVLNNKNINYSRLLFKDTLDLANYIDFDLFKDDKKRTTYSLYAVNECVHTGKYSHYKCYIKLENKWFIFDDDKRVEEFHGYFENSPFVLGLFYKRNA